MIRSMRFVPLFVGLAALCLLIAAPAQAGHLRPKGALKVYASLVPAYQQCATPDRQHGPPLAFPSCSSPTQVTNRLTVGNPPAQAANFEGHWRIRASVGTPGPPDDSCAPNSASISDVRCKGVSGGCAAAGADYTGELEVRVTARISDHWNAVAAGGGTDPATVQDIDLRIPAICTATADPNVGGACSINTDLNVVYPGSIKDGKRMIIEVGQVRVLDGGDDGDTATDDGAQTFLTQGVFIP
jgi:hypothetical protein